jgi:3,4-dihydroxy 2-butanone 4-phosphate synthase/GTP cyclohydrolase II
MVSIADLAQYRRRYESTVTFLASARLPSQYGAFTAHAFQTDNQPEHLALVRGLATGVPPLLSIHHECWAGDLFQSVGCCCRANLDRALTTVAREDAGIVLYLRDEDAGRHLAGVRSLAAVPPAEASLAAHLLRSLGVSQVRLLDQSSYAAGLRAAGIEVVESLFSSRAHSPERPLAVAAGRG